MGGDVYDLVSKASDKHTRTQFIPRHGSRRKDLEIQFDPAKHKCAFSTFVCLEGLRALQASCFFSAQPWCGQIMAVTAGGTRLHRR
jgi:hypothetical protein